MLASEPDITLPSPPVVNAPSRRLVPSVSEIVLVVSAVILSLWFLFGLLTTLVNAWAGWDAASLPLLLISALSGFGALVCLWLSWRLNAKRVSRSDLPFTMETQRAHAASFWEQGPDPDLIYCERDHVLFKPLTSMTDSDVVNETSVM